MPNLTRDQLEERARFIFDSCSKMTPEGFDAGLAHCADDIFTEWPFGPPAPIEGKAALREFLLANTMDFEVTVEHVYVDEKNQVTAATGRSKGKNPRTGLPYSNRYILLFKWRDGLVTEWYEYLDPIQVLKSAGETALP